MTKKLLWTAISLAVVAGLVGLAAIGQTSVKPVIVRDLDNAERGEIMMGNAGSVVFLNHGEVIKEGCASAIPANKRFVVEHYSARILVPTGQSPHVVARVNFSGGSNSLYMVATPQGAVDASRDIWVVSSPVHWVVPPSGTVCLQVDRYPSTGDASGVLIYVGHYMDAP